MATNGWIIEKTVDLANPPKYFRQEAPYEIVYVGDNYAVEWRVDVLKDGASASLGGTVMAYVKRPDGSITASMSTVTNNRCEVTLGSYDFGIAGYVYAVLRYTDSQTHATVTLDAIAFNVQSVEGNRIIDKDGVLPETIDQLLNEIETMREATKAANDAADHANEVADGLEEITLETQRRVLAAFPTDTASGEVVSIPDGADNLPIKQMQVAIEPVQDLHGYDYPWPGGGGKNKLDPEVFSGRSQYQVSGDTITVLASDASSWDLVKSLALEAGTYIYSRTNASGTVTIRTSVDNYESNLFAMSDGQQSRTFTLSENCSIKIKNGNSASSYPFDVKIQIEAGTSATQFEPYSNICPITGWTGANIDMRGKNLLPSFNVNSTKNGVVYSTDDDGVVTFNGTNTGSAFSLSKTVTLEPGNYKISGARGNADFYTKASLGESNRFFITVNGTNYFDLYNSSSFTVTERGTYAVTCVIVPASQSGVAFSNSVIRPMICRADESYLDFKPYQMPHEYNVHFPTSAGIVYGGTLTINEDGSGKLVIDRKGVDMGTLNWIYWNSNYFVATVADKLATSVAQTICSVARTLYYNSAFNRPYIFDMINNNYMKKNIYMSDSRYEHNATGANMLKASLNGQITVYHIQAPIEMSLTIGQVATLLGTNNVSADTGEIITLDYRADVTRYIAKKLAEH